MTHLVALNSAHHQQLKVDASKIEVQGSELHLVPTVVNEFSKAIVHYPIVLTKNGDTGQFVCSIMLGLEEGENLFWEQGQWQGIYTPLQITRQPFFLGENKVEDKREDKEGGKQDNPSNFVVCIDTDNPAIGETGEMLFDENGKSTPYLQAQQSQLEQLLYGEQITRAMINKLIDWDLLTPLALDIMFVDQSTRKVSGLYAVDEDKLAALDAVKVTELHQQNLLAPIYTMIASLGQIYALIDKKNKRLETGQKWFQTAGETPS